MKSKLLLQNPTTGELKVTQADIYGNVFKKYVKEGFKPIGFVSGFDLSVLGLSDKWNDHKEIIEKCKELSNSNGKTKRTLLVEIEIDDKTLIENYPNYRFNFLKPAEFIDVLAYDMEHMVTPDYGCKIKVS